MGSRRYLLRHVLHALATLAFVLAFNFVLFRAIGDPVKLLTRSSLHLDPQEQEALREEFGIDDPLPVQFVNYLGDTLRGEFGYSFISGRPVIVSIQERVWPTILLVGTATILSTFFGVLVGIKGAWRRGSTFDTGSLLGSLTLYSMPEGWLGMMLLILFTGTLGWLPAGGYQSSEQLSGFAHFADVAKHLFLPCLTLTLGYIGEYAIIMRSSLLEVMGEDFVQTARAKGVRDKDVRRRHREQAIARGAGFGVDGRGGVPQQALKDEPAAEVPHRRRDLAAGPGDPHGFRRARPQALGMNSSTRWVAALANWPSS